MEACNKTRGIVSKEARMKTQGVTARQDSEDLDQGSGTKSDKEERRTGKPWTVQGLCLSIKATSPRTGRRREW